MNKHLQQLVLLSKVDLEIDGFEPRIAQINKALKESENKIAKFNNELLQCDEEIKDIKIQQKQNNAHIEEFAAKIKELGKKSSSVKTEREANSLKIEEDIAKEQLESANEEINRLDRILEAKEYFKKEIQESKDKEEAQLQTFKEQIDIQMAELEKERALVYDKKNQIVANINQKILSFYEKIRKWAKNSAVVPVKKQACYGCFMKIYDKTYLAVQKGEEIVTCPHCGRILYKDESLEKNEKNSKELAESLN